MMIEGASITTPPNIWAMENHAYVFTQAPTSLQIATSGTTLLVIQGADGRVKARYCDGTMREVGTAVAVVREAPDVLVFGSLPMYRVKLGVPPDQVEQVADMIERVSLHRDMPPVTWCLKVLP